MGASVAVGELGRTLVLVPHPDDETLGCGGLLALLADAGVPVQVVLLTDGAGSHRASREFPAARLRDVRQREMVAAMRELGLDEHCLSALGCSDGALPFRGEPGFDRALDRLAALAIGFKPETVVMPSRTDEHPDHRAAQALGAAMCDDVAAQARRLEYAVWGEACDGREWRLDVSTVLPEKQRALACHRSQLGDLVHDDPSGFTLPAELIARCTLPVEIYKLTTDGGRNASR